MLSLSVFIYRDLVSSYYDPLQHFADLLDVYSKKFTKPSVVDDLLSNHKRQLARGLDKMINAVSLV